MSITNAQFLELIDSQSIEVRVKLHQLLTYLEESAVATTKGKPQKNYNDYEQDRIKNMSEDILIELSSFNLLISLYNSKKVRTESEPRSKKYFSASCIDISKKTNVPKTPVPSRPQKKAINSKSKNKVV